MGFYQAKIFLTVTLPNIKIVTKEGKCINKLSTENRNLNKILITDYKCPIKRNTLMTKCSPSTSVKNFLDRIRDLRILSDTLERCVHVCVRTCLCVNR